RESTFDSSVAAGAALSPTGCYDATRQRAHQDASGSERGNHDDIAEGGEQHDRRGARAPKTAMLTQDIDISLPCKEFDLLAEKLDCLSQIRSCSVPTRVNQRLCQTKCSRCR